MPAGKAEYTVKSVETVVAGTDVRVRLFTLAPGEVIPWHSHTEIADHFFVLAGELTVEMRAPDRRLALGVGERHEIPAGNIHQTFKSCRNRLSVPADPGRRQIRFQRRALKGS